MTVEAALYVAQLNSNLPAGGDPKSEGDDHLKMMKAVLKAMFPVHTADNLTIGAAGTEVLIVDLTVTNLTATNMNIDCGLY